MHSLSDAHGSHVGRETKRQLDALEAGLSQGLEEAWHEAISVDVPRLRVAVLDAASGGFSNGKRPCLITDDTVAAFSTPIGCRAYSAGVYRLPAVAALAAHPARLDTGHQSDCICGQTARAGGRLECRRR